ncbi:transposase [Pseudomonadales bacterium]|nr:transposase [Pseudomonadales bacterium]
MTTERKRRKFTSEFKKDAVALVTEQDYSIAKAAQAVDMSENNLWRWKKELEREASGERLSVDERAELARLRQENKELRIEKEILKKASAFFAKAMKRSTA